jgi:zinc protease
VPVLTLPYVSTPATWTTLPSGQQIFLIPKPGEVIHLHTLVRTGSVNETDDIAGLSHFLEHLMFKGTLRYPAGEFDRLLEGVGGRVNASTSKDFTQYYITLPTDPSGAGFRLALELHADMLLHAALPEEEIGLPFALEAPPSVKRERQVILEEIKMGLDNPWRQTLQALNELLYPTHPYRREVIGTPAVIASVPRATIVDYYRTWYRPEQMITIVAGPLPMEDTFAQVAQAFSESGLPALGGPAVPIEVPPTTPRLSRRTLAVGVEYLVVGFLGPSAQDMRATVGLDVVSLLLGEGMSSRLQWRLLEELPQTPFIEVGSTHWTFRDSSLLLCYGITHPAQVERARALLLDEVARLHRDPPTAAELTKAVTQLEAHFAAQAETSAGLSAAVADSMARLNSPAGYIEYLPILASLTPDDLARYIEDYLPLEHRVEVIAGPASA